MIPMSAYGVGVYSFDRWRVTGRPRLHNDRGNLAYYGRQPPAILEQRPGGALHSPDIIAAE